MDLNLVEGIYSPRDIWKNPYYIVYRGIIIRNKKCLLTESDYESLCDTYGVNPIYIDNVIVEDLPKVKSPPIKKEDVYDRIRKRREELGHKICSQKNK